MPEVVNTSFLGDTSFEEELNSSSETMIKVDDVSMVFNMASETMNNLKEYAIALAKRELHFKEFRALDHVSLEVKKGDVFGILGTNGSGKSTLLKIIAGVLEPSEGTCTVNGSIAPLIELGAGFDMELTARENIYLNGALLGYSKKFIEQHFEEIVEFAEIEQFLDMPLKNYSSGMVARIAFAIATVIVPEILIVDEVLSVGDFMFQQKCERRINTLIKEHGVTVLIVSHSNEQIERLCNKAIWIEKGHERIAGSAHEVCQVYRMLGGHIGSPESEQRIFNLIKAPKPTDHGSMFTVAGEDRFGTAVKLTQKVFENKTTNEAILLSTDDLAISMLSNTLAASLEAPILSTRRDSLPDITAHALREYNPEKIILFEKEKVSSDLLQAIKATCPDSELYHMHDPNLSSLSEKIYSYITPKSWGNTAVITHMGGSYDLMSLIPLICKNKFPVFFCDENFNLGKKTEEILRSGLIKTIVVLGDNEVVSDSSLTEYKNMDISISRLFAENYYLANRIINDWCLKQQSYCVKNLIFVSVWQPSDALTIGPYASTTSSEILLIDPQDLDCLSSAIEELESTNNSIENLIFIGGSSCFNDNDKELLLKALPKAK